MLTTLDAPYLYAMFITPDASTPYDMLVTLYFSSLPYLYAMHPISVCHASHICMPCISYLYAMHPISVCHASHICMPCIPYLYAIISANYCRLWRFATGKSLKL